MITGFDCIDKLFIILQVYDKDFEEYVLISNDGQLIENLSRIRVKPKETGKEAVATTHRPEEISTAEDINGEDITAEEAKATQKETNEDLKSFIDRIFAIKETKKFGNNIEDKGSGDLWSVNNLNINSESLKSLMEEKCKMFDDLVHKNIEVKEDADQLTRSSRTESFLDSQSVVSCGQASVSTQSSVVTVQQPINYLQIETSDDYRYSPTCPHLLYYTVVERFRKQRLVCVRYKIGDYKGIQKLLDLMTVNRKCFEINRLNDSTSSPKWKVVSDQIVANGFTDWTPKKCKQGFSCALQLYKKVRFFRPYSLT